MTPTTSFSEGEDVTSSSIFSTTSPKSVACISSRFHSTSHLGPYPQKIYLPNDDDDDIGGCKSVTSAASSTTSTASTGYNNNDNTSSAERANLVHAVNENDVLCGRGRGPAGHTGNVRFHELVAQQRMAYLTSTDRKEKANICQDVVDTVKRSGGRFLKKISGNSGGNKTNPKLWVVVDNAKAKAKAGQALREGYTRETVLRAQLLASVADVATPPNDAADRDIAIASSRTKRMPPIDTDDGRFRSYKKMRLEQHPGHHFQHHCSQTPTHYIYNDTGTSQEPTEESRTPALPLKKQIMRRMKEDLLRENQLSAFLTLRGYL